MIRLIEALNFRCLRYIRQPLENFHVLVGPNASGKTTFLDVISLLGQIVSDGVEKAITDRTQNFSDLLWSGQGNSFEMAVEAGIPEEKKEILKKRFDTIRYEIRIGYEHETKQVGILEERALLKRWKETEPIQPSFFPREHPLPKTILTGKAKHGERTVLSKGEKGNDNFYSEVLEESGKGWYPSIRLGPLKSTLANLHEDETRFPVSTWFKKLLTDGVQVFVLNSLAIRKASPPGQARRFKPDGSNLPWVIEDLRLSDGNKRFKEWVAHVRTALPEIENIKTIERADDKHRYMKICYHGGIEVPSWMISDGTLRLLALTIPAYLPEFKGIYLIEEPENGIHPTAVETVYQSLSSVYDAQILLATHSPVILSMAPANKVLCFKKTESGVADIVPGHKHPSLKDWKGQPNLSVLFASGVLG
jgi:predicted ATPase